MAKLYGFISITLGILMLSVASCSLKNNHSNGELKDKYLGNYEKPELLTKLEKLQSDGVRLEFDLGFFPKYSMHYSITPIDVIPFAGTGNNGIHFGFLTDFGYETKLADAPIVVVCPPCDPPVKLVADNLSDFISIVMKIGDAANLSNEYKTDQEFIDEFNDYEYQISKDVYSNADKKTINQVMLDRKSKKMKTINTLIDELGIQPMENVCEYQKELRAKRKQTVQLNDLFGLGIYANCPKSSSRGGFTKRKTAEELTDYLDNANNCQRIQFYRNAAFIYILAKNYNVNELDCMIPYLEKDGYVREARILESEYKK